VNGPTQLSSLAPIRPGVPDDAFITFASPEERCLGVPKLFSKYLSKQVCILTIVDEPNSSRNRNISEIKEAAASVGVAREFHVRHDDAVFGIAELAAVTASREGAITIDISTFPRVSLLLVLRAIELASERCVVRIVYSEPASYDESASNRGGPGFKATAVVPTFVAPFTPSEEVILVMFLGFERDRALGVWRSVEPNKTIAVLASPAYQGTFESRARAVNAPILAATETKNVYLVDARNPLQTYEFLEGLILNGGWPAQTNFYIAPLGTKPQTVGTYCFCRDYPDAACIIHAAPLEHHRQYIASGVGRSWILPFVQAKS